SSWTWKLVAVTLRMRVVTGPPFVAAMQTPNGGDTATLRHRNLGATSVQVQVQEEQSANAEVGHVNEVVGYLVVGDP
ncbi:MAG: hypothetical protein AAFY88_10190, partial [Acidobacteriota bacterium]